MFLIVTGGALMPTETKNFYKFLDLVSFSFVKNASYQFSYDFYVSNVKILVVKLKILSEEE